MTFMKALANTEFIELPAFQILVLVWTGDSGLIELNFFGFK
jgi:hypothetical protein